MFAFRAPITDDNKRTGGERVAHPLRPRHAGGRVGAEDPQGLDPAVQHRLEQLDGLEAGPGGHARRTPEAAHAIDIGRVCEAHMSGELVGKTADLAAAHRIRLPGQ